MTYGVPVSEDKNREAVADILRQLADDVEAGKRTWVNIDVIHFSAREEARAELDIEVALSDEVMQLFEEQV